MTKSQRPNRAPYVCSPNPASSPPPNPENSQSVDQNLPPRWKRILALVGKCRSLLAGQGSIVSPLLDNPAIPPPPPMFVPPLRPYLRAWLWQAINERAMANEAALLAQDAL